MVTVALWMRIWMWSVMVDGEVEGEYEFAAYGAKRRRQDRALSLWRFMERRWRSIMAQEDSV